MQAIQTVRDALTRIKFNAGLFVFLLCSILIGHQMVVVYKYAVNIPDWDDYDAILRFLNKLVDEQDFLSKIKIIFSQHNEHRILFDRLVILGDYLIEGAVDIRVLIWVGNLVFIALFLLLAKVFRDHVSSNWLLFIPVPFLMFSVVSYENYLWAMASLQNVGVVLFSLASLYFLLRSDRLQRREFVWACLLAVLATYTSGNGLLSFGVGGLALLVRREKWSYVAIWSAVAVISVAFYFYGYKPISGHPSPIATLYQKPDLLISHYFVLIGNAFDFMTLSIFLGLALVVLYVQFVTKGLFLKKRLLFFMLTFLMLSCCLTSLSRADFGVTQALAIRYRIYSELIFIFTYYILLTEVNIKSRMVKAGVALFCLWSMSLYVYGYRKHMPELIDRYEKLIHGIAAYHENNTRNFLSYPDRPVAVDILERSKALGTYAVPSLHYADIPSHEEHLELPPPSNDIAFDFGFKTYGKLLFIDNGWAYPIGHDTYAMNTYVVLQSEKKTYILSTYLHTRPDVVTAKNDPGLMYSGFTFIYELAKLDNGVYRVGLLTEQSDHTAFMYVDQDIRIDNGRYMVTKGMQVREDPQFYIDRFDAARDTIHTRGWALIPALNAADMKQEILFKSAEGTRAFVPRVEQRPDVSRAHNGPYDASGFLLDVPRAQLPKGECQVFVQLSFGFDTLQIDTGKKLKN